MRMRTSGGQGGSTRAKRENVAPATARRASHEVASNPLSPTKFEKPAQRAGFLHLQLMRMRTSGGQGGSTRRRPDKTRQRRIRQMCRPLSDAARPPYSTYTTHISLPNLRPHISLSINGFVTETIVFFLYLLKSFLALLMAGHGIFRCAF